MQEQIILKKPIILYNWDNWCYIFYSFYKGLSLNKVCIRKPERSRYNQRDLSFMHCFSVLWWVKVCKGCFETGSFFHLGNKKTGGWSCLPVDRLILTNVWKLTWVDSTLVVLDEWLSYKGGRFSWFDSI